MAENELAIIPASETVWRIGFLPPEPWAWSGWEWAADGRFPPGRWDDVHGNFRTVYAGSSLKACLLEVLAGFRPDPRLASELDAIVEDDEDQVLYPSVPPGEVPPREWLELAPRPVPSSPGTTAPSPHPKPWQPCTRNLSPWP